eukprot:scaffold27221_cov16-Tisochrysis_lutea.AAC.1
MQATGAACSCQGSSRRSWASWSNLASRPGSIVADVCAQPLLARKASETEFEAAPIALATRPCDSHQ